MVLFSRSISSIDVVREIRTTASVLEINPLFKRLKPFKHLEPLSHKITVQGPCKRLKTIKKFNGKIFTISEFPYLCLPKFLVQFFTASTAVSAEAEEVVLTCHFSSAGRASDLQSV